MKKTIATMIAATALTMGFAAQATTAEAEVELVVPTTITQVVAFDGIDTYVMATEQRVEDVVHVTPEMASKAIAFNLVDDVLPEIYSVEQGAMTGESEGAFTHFAKTGMIEPIATSRTVVNKVFFKQDGLLYSFETTDKVGKTVKLSPEVLAMAKKL